MSYTVVVFEKGAVDDPEAVRASVDAMRHGIRGSAIATNPGFSVHVRRFENPPLAIYTKGAIDDEATLRAELVGGLAIIQVNPGFHIDFVER